MTDLSLPWKSYSKNRKITATIENCQKTQTIRKQVHEPAQAELSAMSNMSGLASRRIQNVPSCAASNSKASQSVELSDVFEGSGHVGVAPDNVSDEVERQGYQAKLSSEDNSRALTRFSDLTQSSHNLINFVDSSSPRSQSFQTSLNQQSRSQTPAKGCLEAETIAEKDCIFRKIPDAGFTEAPRFISEIQPAYRLLLPDHHTCIDLAHLERALYHQETFSHESQHTREMVDALANPDRRNMVGRFQWSDIPAYQCQLNSFCDEQATANTELDSIPTVNGFDFFSRLNPPDFWSKYRRN